MRQDFYMENTTNSRKSYLWVFIALIVALAAMAGSYGQFQLPPLQDQVQAEANMTPAQYTQAFTAPMLPGLCLSLVAGVLIDRFGYRKMIALALLVSTLGTVGRVFCSSFFPYVLAMVLTGVAPTFVQSNNAKIMSNYVPPEKLSFAIGVVMLGGSLANYLGTATTHLYPSTTAAYISSGILGLVAIVLWLLCLREKKQPAEKSAAAAEAPVTMGAALKNVVRSGNVWRIGLCMFFVETAFMSVTSTAPSALKSLDYDPGTAGLLAALLSVGSPIGNMLGAPLIIRSGKPKLCLFVIFGVTAVAFPLLWSSSSVVLCAIAFLLLGFSFGCGLITIASLPIRLPEIGQKYAGTAGGLINTMEMAGAFLLATYVIAPIANGNFRLQFLLAAGMLALGCLSVLLIPKLDLGRKD